MDATANRAEPGTQCYQRRRPERTLWYHTVQTHFETWLERSSQRFEDTPPAYVERAFRRYLEYGILAHGFARAYCDECKHDFLIAFSCKGRGVCPSCNTRRMSETAAHLADHVFPPLPVRKSGAVRAKTAALFPATRCGTAGCRVAYLFARGGTLLAGPQPRLRRYGTHWGGGVHPPFWLLPE